jgi:protein SCO1/2
MQKTLFPVVFFLLFLSFFPVFSETKLKNYTLQNQSGKNFQLYDIIGNYLLVSFIYTRCPMPKMCPLTMSLNRRVYRLWKKNSPSIPLKFLVVTLDPANDTANTMKSYGSKFGLTDSAFILATGSEQTISDFSSEFNALGFPSNGLIAHNSKSVLVGPDLIPLKDYKDNEWKPEDVIKDLKTLSKNKH